jgi:putative peptide-modifying radical SAM enzyme
MFFHVIVTTECPLQCRYCFGEALKDTETGFRGFDLDYSLPEKIDYDFDVLDRFCKRDDECVLILYGGEPLLHVDVIKKILDRVTVKHFILQTSGVLLHTLAPEYVNRFHTILVSIDGDEALTDYYRGTGTFRKTINNLKLIAQNGFQGEIVARMTVMEQTDINKQVKWLIENDDFPFSSVHWQLNAGFWDDFPRRTFKTWSENNYNPGIRRLVNFWVQWMETKGTVLRLYPFLGIARSLLVGEDEALLRCGGGWINYAIQTDGHLIPCPTMWGMKDYYVGHIRHADPSKLKRILVSEPCTTCDTYPVCGGRCLYANLTKRWNAESYGLVCDTVRNLVDAVARELPRIRKLIRSGDLSLKDFNFLEYNGCEIIP